MTQRKLPTYEELSRPLSAWHPKAIYFGLMRFFLKTVGQLSEGVRIGLTHGFDSGVMLEYVYRNRPAGVTFVGKAIDRIYLNSQGWQGIRERGQILKGVLKQTIQTYQSQGITTQLLDVACGGGRYDLEVLRDFPANTFTATLRDYKVENVQKAQELAAKLDVRATIEQADAFSDSDLNRVQPRPNIIVVSGLHEILPDNDLIENHFRQLYRILASQGTLIFTIQPFHPQLELIARVLNSHTHRPWVMRLRSYELTKTWANAAGFKDFELQMDSFGIFGVVRACKE
ncbi:methyltransferase domain-containing protein [Synechococcales cyanobacterium C]|uniref:Methyltransferase domain-containing protein n=1 Tax=Petrachloros mirabilis ULC683 TaxID=2781853 RepID=A0A8K2AN84_9CYAN|nr:class I SAM-dependent methyltransferase family protein [Petrachloros mirabilis]NCJ04938.1 methyltransferase domain-containing protein [Petrachloros mirabilis ULC683]